MLGLSKKTKKSEETNPVVTNQKEDFNRNETLSLWFDNIDAAKTAHSQAEDKKPSLESRRKEGYIFCRKCYKIHSAKELICPACGTASNKKNK